jgi:pimeloyl-ACP methyl ester carboxylesterase
LRILGRTPPFRAHNGAILQGSIAEAGFVRLGGVDQWVLFRGESTLNPPLIVLHGGPGFSDVALFRHFNAPLEKHFVVTHWDQRGTRRSFFSGIPPSSMTVEQFIADLDELIDAVRHRFDKDKVAIFGHSWGTALGVLYASRFPEKVSAYVGSGQIGNWQTCEAAVYEFALSEAKRHNNGKALKQLLAIGPPPHTPSRLSLERTWIRRLDGQMSLCKLWDFARILFASPESSIFDLPNLVRGFQFSLESMWPEVSQLNLLQAAPELQIPVFFLLGRNDHWVPAEFSVDYFNKLIAPSKRLIWFEASGHEPFADEPEKFNAAMAELVRPAIQAGPTPTVVNTVPSD